VGFPPGGPVDVITRTLAQQLGELIGQPVVVDNRAGAGGIIGTELVARAAPDGYTLMMASTTLAIQETLYNNLTYSALRDFTPIAEIAAGPQVLVVNTTVPAKNVQELIALARTQPGKLNYASPSSGGANHLAAEMLKSVAGIDVTHIPYKGGAPAEVDLIGGRVTFMFASLPAAVTRVRAGQLRALGVTSLQRVVAAPDIPTLAESGLPGFEVISWYGIVGPAGIPAPVVARLNNEINKALDSPAMKERMVSLGVEGTPGTPDEFAAFIRRDTAKWAKVIKDSGAKPE
jgi:tripartite-type tricarboxylate transporter receptor subunit TctC